MKMCGGRWIRSLSLGLLGIGLLFPLSLTFSGCALSGCRARMVNATIVNHGPQVKLLEFDYPEASFGVDRLASGGGYRYSFQIRGSGPVTLTFLDASGKSHTSKGPTVSVGEEGSLMATIGQDYAVKWSRELVKR